MEFENTPMVPNQNQPGYSQAIASLVLGIISVVCCFFGWSSILSVVLGIIGLVLAHKAKTLGCHSGMRTAGFVLSLIGLLAGGVTYIACIACVGALGVAGSTGLLG